MNTQKATIIKLIEEAKEAGCNLIFHYPQKKQVAFNGGRRISYAEAIPELKANIAHRIAWKALISEFDTTNQA